MNLSNKMFSSAKMAKCAKSLSRYCLLICNCLHNSLELVRNQCVSTLFGGRFFTGAAKRLMFSYRSMDAEARIYTGQFD